MDSLVQLAVAAAAVVGQSCDWCAAEVGTQLALADGGGAADDHAHHALAHAGAAAASQTQAAVVVAIGSCEEGGEGWQWASADQHHWCQQQQHVACDLLPPLAGWSSPADERAQLLAPMPAVARSNLAAISWALGVAATTCWAQHYG